MELRKAISCAIPKTGMLFTYANMVDIFPCFTRLMGGFLREAFILLFDTTAATTAHKMFPLLLYLAGVLRVF